MSELDVTFDTPHGPVTMPWPQAMKIAELLKALEDQGKQVTWHKNLCGCCYAVHENVEGPAEGWVVGTDGGADYHTDLNDHHEN